MKKYILTTLITLIACTTLSGQNMFSGSTDLQVIANEWEHKTLKGVTDGSLVNMLDCFNKTWPTWMLKAAVKTMKKGVAGRDTYNDGHIVVHNKPKNGWVQTDWYGTVERHEFMRACYWKRSNGHRLLGIYFGGNDNHPEIHFVCFYDYDINKHTLTPEPQIIDGFRTTADKEFYYELPEEGKEMRIYEYGSEGNFLHTFGWDGMKPVLSKTEEMPDDADGEHCDEEEE